MKKALVLLFIFILAFSIRSYYIVSNPTTLESDQIEHDKLAVSILTGEGYVDNKGFPTAYRLPGYPVFLASIYKIFGHNLLVVKIIQAVLSSLSVCLLFLIALKLFNNAVAFIVGIFSSFYMTFVACSNLLYSETLFTFLLVLMTFLAVITNKVTVKRFILLGFLCGLLALVKSVAFFIPLIVIAYLVFKTRKDGCPKIKKVLICATMVLCFAVTISPWVIRNYNVFKKVVLTSTNSGINLYQGVSWYGGRIYYTGPPEEEIWRKSRAITNETERNDLFLREALKIYKNNPMQVIKTLPVKVLFFWNIIDWEILGGNIVNYHYVFIFPFAIFGLLICFREKKDILLFVMLISYFVLLTFIFPGAARYRMPVDGYIIMIGCYGIYKLVELSKKKIYIVTFTSTWFFLTYLIYKYSIQSKIFVKNIVEKIGLW